MELIGAIVLISIIVIICTLQYWVTENCPKCRSRISYTATRCKYCHADIERDASDEEGA